MRHWLIDSRPLQIYPEYRRFWLGTTLSAIGNHITVFAATLQIFTLTNNSAAVGALGLFTGIPAILLALWGGSLGDKFDRKKLIVLATILQTLGCCLLWGYSLIAGSNIFFIYCMIGLIFFLGALSVPASTAILPSLVGSDYLQAAIILRMFSMHSAMIIGPIVGGFLVPRYGLSILYFIDLMTFFAALYGIVRLPSMAPQQAINKRSWATVKSGLQFVKGAPIILGALYVDFALTFFGIPNALFPAINEEYFGGYADHLGLMVAAPSLGGVVAMLFSGRLNHLTAPALGMIILCCLWALSVMSFALSTFYTFSLLLLFIMGGLDSLVASLRSTLIQKATSDEFRARVSALEYIVSNIAPQLGNVRAGLLTVMVTPHIAALVGGLSTLIMVLLNFIIIPAFVRRSTSLISK